MGNKTEWVFTFGQGQRFAGHYVRLSGDYDEARQKMFDAFGDEWAFQYPAEQWAEWEQDPERAWLLETELFEERNESEE